MLTQINGPKTINGPFLVGYLEGLHLQNRISFKWIERLYNLARKQPHLLYPELLRIPGVGPSTALLVVTKTYAEKK